MRATVRLLRDLLLLAIHVFVTVAKLLRPGRVRAVAAESLLLKLQIIIGNRSRRLRNNGMGAPFQFSGLNAFRLWHVDAV